MSIFPKLFAVCFVAFAVLAGGCQSSPDETAGIGVDLQFEPAEPVVGDAKVLLRLTDPAGKPIEKADVIVEGNMNHAGMKPSFAEMSEGPAGTYSGTLDFTMGGDWFLLVSVTMPDGSTLERKIDVPGVKTK